MEYTFEKFEEDLDKGHKIYFTYLKNKYLIYKVTENCYMQELVEQKSRNAVQEKAMITHNAIKMMFPYQKNYEYKV